MSFAHQATEQKFPFPYDRVFDGLIETLPKAGFKVKSSDKLIGRILFSTGWSLFSYGENLTIVVEKVDERTTNVGVRSALKAGMNFAGAHRHSSNFNKIIAALSSHLQLSGMGNFKDREEAVIQRPPPPPPQTAATPINSGSRAPNSSAPTGASPRAGNFKFLGTRGILKCLKWIGIGTISLLVLFIVIGLIGNLFSPDVSKESSVPRPAQKTDIREPADVSTSDFQIVSVRAEWISEGFYVIGEVRNNGNVAAGVEVQATARDNKGQLIDSAMFWPNSVNNIPPGSSVGVRWNVTFDKTATRGELQVVAVKIW